MNDDALVPDQLLATARPPQPYPGLRPFEMEEWSIFFGRERMIDDVIELLARHRLVVVHGASGSGKSSLVRAGILPRLARQHLCHGVPWRAVAMRPSDGPLWNLAVALAPLEGRDGDISRVEKIRRAFDRADARLRDAVAKEIGLAGQQLCILIDQFEELFRYAREISRDESQLFIELLAGLIGDYGDSGVHAVVTLRSEFLGECARYEGLAEAINRTQYLLPRMDREGLLHAIRRPAELYGGKIDADLAERLIADAGGGQDELPLIQHALRLLWNQALTKGDPPCRLGLDIFREQEGGVAALLSDHASQVMAAVAPDPPQQTVVELLFRALTDITAEGQGIRRPQRFDRLVAVTGGDREILWEIIEAFRDEGVSFLTPYPPKPINDETVIEISHEALVRCWRRIADPEDGWLQREFKDGLIWRSLLAPAERFERNPKDVLSPALTEDRRVWLEGRPTAWCERYGGGWHSVTELIRASEASAFKSRQREIFWQSFLVVIPKSYQLFKDFTRFGAFLTPYKRKLDMMFGRDLSNMPYVEWFEVIVYYTEHIAPTIADLRSADNDNDIRHAFHRMIELGGNAHRLIVEAEELWVELRDEILRCDEVINNYNQTFERHEANWHGMSPIEGLVALHQYFHPLELSIIKINTMLLNLLLRFNEVQQLWIG